MIDRSNDLGSIISYSHEIVVVQGVSRVRVSPHCLFVRPFCESFSVNVCTLVVVSLLGFMSVQPRPAFATFFIRDFSVPSLSLLAWDPLEYFLSFSDFIVFVRN